MLTSWPTHISGKLLTVVILGAIISGSRLVISELAPAMFINGEQCQAEPMLSKVRMFSVAEVELCCTEETSEVSQ